MARNAARKKNPDASLRQDAPTLGRNIMQAGTYQIMATLQTVDDDRKPSRADFKRAVQHLRQGSNAHLAKMCAEADVSRRKASSKVTLAGVLVWSCGE